MRRTSIGLLIALLWAAPARAAITFVVGVAGASANALDVTTGPVDTTGANFCAAATLSGAGAATAPSDSKTNTWTALPPARYNNTSSAGYIQIYYSQLTSVGAGHTFTLNTGGAGPSIAVLCFAGVKTSASFDQENGDTTSPLGATIQAGSVTPGENGEVVIIGGGHNVVEAIASINGGFTIGAQTNGSAFAGGVGAAYLIQGALAAANPTWTFTTFQNVAASIATFKVAAPATNRPCCLKIF